MGKNFSTINALYVQIAALLDLMNCCNGSVSMESIRTTTEMCITMMDELKAEVDSIEIALAE